MRTLLMFLLLLVVLNAHENEMTFTIFEDASGSEDIASIISKDKEGLFKPTQKQNLGFTESVIWMRVDLHNDGSLAQNRIIMFDYPLLAKVDAYRVSADGIELKSDGRNMLFEKADIIYPSPVFSYVLAPKTHERVYLRIDSDFILFLGYHVHDEFGMIEHLQTEFMNNVIIVGMILALLLYNAFLLFVTRDRVYLYYILYFTGSLMAVIGNLNFSKTYLSLAIDGIVVLFWGGITLYAFGAPMLLRLFEQTATSFDKKLAWSVSAFAASHMIFGFGNEMTGMHVYANFSSVIATTGLALLIGRAWVKGHPMAKYIALGWGGFLATTFTFVIGFHGYGDAELNSMFKYGVLFEGFVFAAVLGYRLKSLNELRLKEQTEASVHEQHLWQRYV